jgi:hypothetical protein
MPKISRDAQIIAKTFFALGRPCSVSFGKLRKLTDRALQAFEELHAAGMITTLPDLPIGARGWKATDLIGFPLTDYRQIEDIEVFPMFESQIA